MGIGHIPKIDDRYTNTDRWSIISNNYLVNVFTDYNYSDKSLFQECAGQKKWFEQNRIVFLQTIIFN